MPKFSLSDLKKSSVYITPNFPAITTKRYKFGIYSILGFGLFYTLIITVIISLIIALTPVKNYIFILENEQLKEESAKVEKLEEKVVLLAAHLNEISSANKKLEYALLLAENADSLDSSSAVYDTLKENLDEIKPEEGHVLSGLFNLFEKLFDADEPLKQVFVNPVEGYVIYGFAPAEGHMGIDYGVKTGTPVYATSGGMVLFANYTIEDGYKLLIKHDNGYYSLYKHCGSLVAKERDYVNQGELIALSGNTGSNTSGPHLHFEIWKEGKAVDPAEVLLTKRR